MEILLAFLIFMGYSCYGFELNVAVLDIDSNKCPFEEEVYKDIVLWMDNSANLKLPKKMIKVKLDDEIFDYPILLLSCKESPSSFDFSEIVKLRRYFNYGGNILINDATGKISSQFSYWVKSFSENVFNSQLEPLKTSESFFKSFFIINKPYGRYLFSFSPEGSFFQGRYPILFFRNDLYSIWKRDLDGNYLYKCFPQGEIQREMGKRAFLNALMYFLTDDYKSDAIHQPLIIEKIRKIDSQLMEY